jgi:hypothetical protein
MCFVIDVHESNVHFCIQHPGRFGVFVDTLVFHRLGINQKTEPRSPRDLPYILLPMSRTDLIGELLSSGNPC